MYELFEKKKKKGHSTMQIFPFRTFSSSSLFIAAE
jgi:hypothetical protein